MTFWKLWVFSVVTWSFHFLSSIIIIIIIIIIDYLKPYKWMQTNNNY